MRNTKHTRIEALEAVLGDQRIPALIVFMDSDRKVVSATVPNGRTVERKGDEPLAAFITRARRLLLPKVWRNPREMSDEELNRRILELNKEIAAYALGPRPSEPTKRATKPKRTYDVDRSA